MLTEPEIELLSGLVTRIAEITAAHNDTVLELVALKERVEELENYNTHPHYQP